MRRSVLAWAALACLASPFPARAATNTAKDAMATEAEKVVSQGWSVKRKLLVPAGGGSWYGVYVFEDPSGDHDRLRVWLGKGRAAQLCYLELSSSHRIALEHVHDGGKMPALYGDGKPTLAYSISALGTSSLRLVRFSAGKASPESTPLPEGRLQDLDGDGQPEVVTRSLPLGSLFDVECGGFHTMARFAYRSSIYAFKNGALEPASQRYAGWFDSHIADIEGRLAALDPRATQTTGEYLSAALSLYFDHAEKGMPRQGWSRFTELYRAGPSDSAPVAQCMEQVRTDLRRKLNIPDSWQ
ncbi:MAG: hypothetical protein NTX64_01125 [Elusimicrobia bacterium]|nr:hypothetical protein [Elusimicrobiota bacterium]